VLGLGIRGIPLGTRWQSWSVFGLAMTLVPFVLIILEALVLIVILILVGIFLASQPNVVVEIERLSRQLYMLGPDPETAQRLLLPYISNPGVIAVALVYFSFLVPLMEELFKPLGVWFLANKLSSPAQGFALGALSGSAYALIETLGVSGQAANWAGLLASRIGTGMLHITTSAIMGAGIVYALRQRRYLRLLGSYVLAVSLHGLWNALAILYGFATISKSLGEHTFLNDISMPVTIGMVILGVGLFTILMLSNWHMRANVPSAAEEAAQENR
jgi:hypothetical protein